MTRRYVKRRICGIAWMCCPCGETHYCVRMHQHKGAHSNRQDVVIESTPSAYGCQWDGQQALRFRRPDDLA